MQEKLEAEVLNQYKEQNEEVLDKLRDRVEVLERQFDEEDETDSRDQFDESEGEDGIKEI